MERIDVNEVISLLAQGNGYKQISDIFIQRYPNQHGYSLNSVKRFCYKHGISSRIANEFVKSEVKEAVMEVDECPKFFFFNKIMII